MKRRGRPPLDPDDHSISVHVRLVSKHYDALCARAQTDRATLPEIIRRALREDLVSQNRRRR